MLNRPLSPSVSQDTHENRMTRLGHTLAHGNMAEWKSAAAQVRQLVTQGERIQGLDPSAVIEAIGSDQPTVNKVRENIANKVGATVSDPTYMELDKTLADLGRKAPVREASRPARTFNYDTRVAPQEVSAANQANHDIPEAYRKFYSKHGAAYR